MSSKGYGSDNYCDGRYDSPISCEVCLKELREALMKFDKEEIEVELLTATPPPAGRPPNIRGVIKKVNKGTIEILLTSGPPGRIGVFSICQIIGVVPRGEDEEPPA